MEFSSLQPWLHDNTAFFKHQYLSLKLSQDLRTGERYGIAIPSSLWSPDTHAYAGLCTMIAKEVRSLLTDLSSVFV